MSSSKGDEENKKETVENDFVTATDNAKPEEDEKKENESIIPDIKEVLLQNENKEDSEKNENSPPQTENRDIDNNLEENSEQNDNSKNENENKSENSEAKSHSENVSEQNSSRTEKDSEIEDSKSQSESQIENDENQKEMEKSKKASSQKSKTPSSRSKGQNPHQKTRRVIKKPKQEEEQIPEELVDQATNEILDGADPNEGYDYKLLRAVTKRFYEMKNKAQQERRYLDAQEYTKHMKSTQKAADVGEFTQHCVTKLNGLIDKEMDAQQQLDELNEKWENEFREFEEVIEEKKQALIEQHTQELNEFDNSIPSELPPKYLKHSPEYIQMRKTENSLARNQRFTEAEAMKRKADRLEEIEIQKQMEKLQADVIFQREALIQRQNRQVDLFAQWVAERRHQLLKARDRDMEGRAIRLDHYNKLVYNIEKKGLPPNRSTGFSTNRVSRKESIRAVRTASTVPRTPTTRKREELPLQYRPQSAIARKSALGNSTRSQRRSALVTPTTNKR